MCTVDFLNQFMVLFWRNPNKKAQKMKQILLKAVQNLLHGQKNTHNIFLLTNYS